MREFIESCDTVAIPKHCSATGCNILGKNSDREVVEAQPLLHFPAQDHAPGEKCKCTYIEIDQVPHTYAMIGSKPWWIWGFEMGANECGVAIGNEAEHSEVAPVLENSLLGMDLLRLGLERGATAKEALDVIIELLEKHGQGGACRYGGTIEETAYHNTFIISDPDEMYVLETVNRQWIYKKVKDCQGISNVYSTQEDYDGISAGLIDMAIEHGLHTPGDKFNFMKSFTLFNRNALSGYPRYRWAEMKLKEQSGNLDTEKVLGVLRSHYEGTFVEGMWSPVSGYIPSVCMHGADPNGSQTAATMVIEYHDTKFKELLYTYWGSMCPPCCSIIVPFYNTGYIPEKLAKGENVYSDDSFWWKVKRLVTDIESNYEKYIENLKAVRGDIEAKFYAEAKENEAKALELLEDGKKDEACKLLNDFTDKCLDIAEKAYDKLIVEIEADMKVTPPQAYRKPYGDRLRERAKLNF